MNPFTDRARASVARASAFATQRDASGFVGLGRDMSSINRGMAPSAGPAAAQSRAFVFVTDPDTGVQSVGSDQIGARIQTTVDVDAGTVTATEILADGSAGATLVMPITPQGDIVEPVFSEPAAA